MENDFNISTFDVECTLESICNIYRDKGVSVEVLFDALSSLAYDYFAELEEQEEDKEVSYE
jgi:hypothetical protein